MPAIHLLPANLAPIAKLCADSTGKYATEAVRVAFEGNRYIAESTSLKSAIRVTGECEPADEYPTATIPTLATAPNGETESLIPAKVFASFFNDAKKKTKRLKNKRKQVVATVCGKDVTTLAATDNETPTTATVPNNFGKFPPLELVIDQTHKDQKEAASSVSFSVDARLMAELLTVLAEYSGDDMARVTITVNNVKGATGEYTRAIRLETGNDEQRATGILMPLIN